MGKPWREFEIWRNFKYFSLGRHKKYGLSYSLCNAQIQYRD
jgi:hypothetical protein